jgi:hypothetical protein
VFLPNSQVVAGAWPVTNVDFKAYAKGALSIELGRGLAIFRAAGDAGQNIEFQVSTNLVFWEPLTKATMDTNGFCTFEDAASQTMRFLRFKRLE